MASPEAFPTNGMSSLDLRLMSLLDSTSIGDSSVSQIKPPRSVSGTDSFAWELHRRSEIEPATSNSSDSLHQHITNKLISSFANAIDYSLFFNKPPFLATVTSLPLNSKSEPTLSTTKDLLTGSIENTPLVGLKSHDSLTGAASNIKNSANALWNLLLNLKTPLNVNIVVGDLPAGELAQAQLGQFDEQGLPSGGTIVVDSDANGKGWFIDPTPFENSEFNQSLSKTAFLASKDSAAFGHYDLFTTLLHEFGHLAGLIDGYSDFDSNIQTINGSQLFVTPDFSTSLSGEHLDPKVHPTDLLNPILLPSVRKLPSTLDIQLLTAVRSTGRDMEIWGDRENPTLTASLTSSPLPGINNGRFDSSNSTDPNYSWSTRGATAILNGQAVLTEDDRLLSNFSQTFIIPEGAKSLQFTLIDTKLGASDLDPPDAFEVALLDAATKTSLVGTAASLTQTDAFLNLQHTGQTYFSPQVTLPGAATSASTVSLNSPRTAKIDLSGVAAGTVATLYFDLLGFGEQDGSAIIDNVLILNDNLTAPLANNDTATTDQAMPVAIDVLTNDSDSDGTIDPTTLQLAATPANGKLIVNSNGSLTYTPTPSFVGTDSFSYTVFDNDSAMSNEATVTVTVNNVPPEIADIAVETNVREGLEATFSATATDPGLEPLTYTWDFGDTSTLTGQAVSHIYADNGTYTTTLTVTDATGGSTSQTLSINVQNVPPIVEAGKDQTVLEGEFITFSGSKSDPGILDTHTVDWDFGDGTIAAETLIPTHAFIDNGLYSVTLTVTDNDGGVTSDTLNVTVNNVSPTITDFTGDTNINEGAIANFAATATDAGNDTLTYAWDFGDGSLAAQGQTQNHTFADDGVYTTTLSVTDDDGSSTIQTLTVNVNNVAPVVNAGLDQTSTEGQAVTFNGSFTDPGIVDTHKIVWDFGDGTTESGILSPTHIYTDNGTYSATLNVTDDEGGATSDNTSVTVNNTNPTITNVSVEPNINEGITTTFSATATDPGLDPLIYTWNFGDGTEIVTGQEVNHIFTDNGTYSTTLTVTDDDGGSIVQMLSVNVANSAPVVVAGSSQTTTASGQTFSFNGSFTDSGTLDTHTTLWNFGDGTQAANTLNPTHTYINNGVYPVTLTVTDNNGGVGSDTLSVKTTNVPPKITQVSGETSVNEGATVTYSATATDASADTLVYTWDFGDGTQAVTNQTVNHIFAKSGVYTVALTVTDADGGSAASTLLVTALNVAPTITQVSGGDSQVNEGAIANFSATATDPGNDSLAYTWNFGDGTEIVTGKAVNHIFADNGTYTTTLTVTDIDGASTTQTLALNVNNVAPLVAPGADRTVVVSDLVTFSGSFSDPGVVDTHTILWNFGDGTIAENTLTPSHTYLNSGIYSVALSVTDDDGASNTNTTTLTVNNDAPTITTVSGDTNINEGTIGNFSATATAPGANTLTYTWDFGDGTEIVTGDLVNHVFADNGIYTTTLSVADSGGGNATQNLKVTVNNVAPVVNPGTDQTVVVGQAVTFSGSFTDPGVVDTHTILWDFGDGTQADSTLSPTHTYTNDGTYLVAMTVTDDDGGSNATTLNVIVNSPPSLSVNDRTNSEGDDGTTNAIFTVNLSSASAVPVTVNFATANNTATAETDYTATSGTLTFAPGQTTQTISVPVIGERVDELDESFFINLSDATNAIVADPQGVGTIVDNDSPPTLVINEATILEGDNGTTNAIFSVNLSAASAMPVTVNFATANGTATAGTDYTATSGTLTFAPGQITQTISVPVVGDRLDELDESFVVNLSNATNATIADAQSVGIVIDNDSSPSLSVSVSPRELWPPNHKMVEVKANFQVSDDSDPAPAIKLQSITSNEPDNGLGDGDTSGDIEIRSDGRIFLRAERSGKGTGRVYTLTYSATDSAGNVTLSTAQVRIPHSRGK